MDLHGFLCFNAISLWVNSCSARIQRSTNRLVSEAVVATKNGLLLLSIRLKMMWVYGYPYQKQTNNVCASLISIFSIYSRVAYAFNNLHQYVYIQQTLYLYDVVFTAFINKIIHVSIICYTKWYNQLYLFI